MSSRLVCLALFAPAALIGACGSDGTCELAAQEGCDKGFACEEVEGQEEPACMPAVVLRGKVFDLDSGEGLANARIVALDANQAPVSSVAISNQDGMYELQVPSRRDADGNPYAFDVTLRADAAGYQTFPGGVRQAVPVDTGAAMQESEKKPWVVRSSLTDIALVQLIDGSGTAAIHGTAEVPDSRVGVLIVAEGAGQGYTAVADRQGNYKIFSLPPGEYEVTAYARGLNYNQGSMTLADGDDGEVDLSIASETDATLSGSVKFVEPGEGLTSIILVVASTFDEALARGASVPGLRAPEPGIAPDVSQAFSISGVPAGDYVILAGFENDQFVRDPDPCQAGTDFVYQTMGESDVTVADQFKVTQSLTLVGPGAEGPEAVSGTPMLSWNKDASAAAYDITVVDSFGEPMWEHRLLASSEQVIQVEYGGDEPLEPGVYYQVRVVSLRRLDTEPICKISSTEDLLGVFFVE
jgi:hypothetical protein